MIHKSDITHVSKLSLLFPNYWLSWWGAVTAFLWGNDLTVRATPQISILWRGQRHHVRNNHHFKPTLLCTWEGILYKTLPIECTGLSGIQYDVWSVLHDHEFIFFNSRWNLWPELGIHWGASILWGRYYFVVIVQGGGGGGGGGAPIMYNDSSTGGGGAPIM